MNKPTFHFDEYIVRPVEEKDRAYINQWAEEDPYHRGRMDADDFLKLMPGEDAWAIEDERGNVMLYFKTQTAARVSLLFGQGKSRDEKHKNALVLIKGMAWIEAQLRANKFREYIFQTDGPELTALAKRRMGFTESSGELHKGITPLIPQQPHLEPAIQDCRVYRKEG
jgi:hypothetical protein